PCTPSGGVTPPTPSGTPTTPTGGTSVTTLGNMFQGLIGPAPSTAAVTPEDAPGWPSRAPTSRRSQWPVCFLWSPEPPSCCCSAVDGCGPPSHRITAVPADSRH